MFTVRQTYKRSDLHRMFGGQEQGGISTPAAHSFLMLFTGEQGEQYGYKDGWEDGVFYYTGEGQKGDMPFVRGNRAIRDHAADGKDLHLFKYESRGQVRYVGQMVCTGFHEGRGPDTDGNDRKTIVFELTPISAIDAGAAPNNATEEEIWRQPIQLLRDRAIASSNTGRSPSERRNIVRYRSDAIRVYVLRRANGICEACGSDAPFRTEAGRPYLEPHHIRRLSDGGPDHPKWVAAVCPNCHRRAHYGEDRGDFNKQLTRAVDEKERQN